MRRIVMLAILLAGCTSPAIETFCNATEEGVDCSFSNVGGKGSTCVEITLARNDGKLTTKTDKPICSGDVDKLQTVNVSGTFSDPQPGDVCKNTEGAVDWELCTLEVKTVD
jgi:hypothetical protein